jgi:tetratricopeptide (TPR) repeat protein
LAEKKRLLEEASSYNKRSVDVSEQVIPFDYWNRGTMLIEFANLRAELSHVEEDCKSERKVLEEAISLKEQGLQLCVEGSSHFEKTKDLFIFVALGQTQYSQAKLLIRLHELTHEAQHLEKAMNSFQEALASFQKPGLPSRVAECYWKIASCHDAADEHLKAAEAFTLAANSYREAADKIPQLKGFYEDYAFYMKAWSEIERAKHYHRNYEYGLATRDFEKAAGLLKGLTKWRYLTPNYLAWAKIEYAEELSRKERCGKAIQAFEQAATLFRETEKSVEKKLEKIENRDEKQMATDLLKVSDLRYKYCMARAFIEDAKMLDKKGDYYASAREYGSIVEVFEAMAKALEPEEDVRELRFIAALSRAWEKMTLAEHKDMPILYAESAQLFEKAGENATNDAARFLALGHSRFCSGLEAGTQFLDTQEMTMYSTAMQCLESAARYYKKAGLKIDAENTKATELLFEAHVHVNNAKKEVDPEKRARLYKLTEVILQESSDRYERAKRPDKKNQVLSALKTVREDREWALSCAQVLSMGPLVSAAYVQEPTPTPERAVGLNDFENANIQAYLSAPKETVVGNTLDIRLDLINVAKSFGLLVRVEKLVPPSLKTVTSDPRMSLEDGSLDLMGKRLEPLKVDSIKINAQATEQGTFTLSPKVVFVDNAGRFKTCRPKPVHVTVKPRPSFEFKVKSAEAILAFLASSYFEDNEKKMPLDRCGWRSLPDVMKNGKVPRSSVYRVGGGRGIAIAELEKHRLIETKVIPGERGRGGNILKLRICYEKEEVKRYTQQYRLHGKNDHGRSSI